MNRLKHRNRTANTPERRGAAVVELAACLPVFMLTLMGIIEFGRAMSVSQLLNAAAREGCRAAIIDGSTDTSIRSLVTQQVAGTVNCPENSVTVNITVTAASGQQLSGLSQAEPRDLIAVNVSVPHSTVSYSLSRWLAGKTLRGACAMRHE